MLYYETIQPQTLELLKKLLQIEIIRDTRLVGGTSLALQVGHRQSIDLDLFGVISADEFAISESLAKIGTTTLLKKTPNIYVYLIDGIKVDIVNFPYPWLEELKKIDRLRLAGIRDIAAMKLSAITGRGTKKDFVDLYFVLQQYSLKEVLDFYSNKFFDGSEFLVLKSLTYFDDAETDDDLLMLQPVTWTKIKSFISNTTESYLRNL